MNKMNLPFVTVICPTMPSRKEWLPKAIDCFLSQDYEGIAELIIVADPDPEAHAAEIMLSCEPCHPMRDGSKRSVIICTGSIGAKRNAGCEAAAGEIIVHLDDDDHSGPGRLTDQVKRLIETGKSVTGYHSMRFTDGSGWWKISNPAYWAFDASLCYTKAFWEAHRFDEINDGLEASFRAAAIREKQFISVDAGEMMHCSIHPDNTSKRDIGTGWMEIAAPELKSILDVPVPADA
jgi:glycosyltransferase involved in cell wall biosynthesis